MLASGLLQLLQVGHIQLVVQQKDGLGAEAGDLEQLGQAGRGPGQELLVGGDLACLQVLLHLVGYGPSHARYGLETLLPADEGDVLRQALYGTRSFAVGNDLEAVLGLQLQELGHLVEDVGDLAVFHGIEVRACLVIMIFLGGLGLWIMASKELRN